VGIAQVQKLETENAASVSSFTATYASAVAGGNLLFAVIRLGSTNAGLTISDNVNAGNWTQAFLTHDTTNARWLGLFYKENTAAGTPIVTASWTGVDASIKGLNVYEYRGLATSSSIDGNNSAVTASTTTPASGDITTTNASDLLIGAFSFSTNATDTVTSESTGFTQQHDDTIGTAAHDHLHVADQIVASTGIYQYQPTISGAQICVIGIAAFKAAAASGGIAPPVPDTAYVFVEGEN
jgi:hypothetical protein